MNNQQAKLCIYCQRNPVDGKDHVPPKNLFPKPRPSTLVSVPACKECNEGASLDDEYFKLIVPSRHDVGENKSALETNESALRGLFRKKSTGLKNKFLKSVEEVELHTPSGLYMGNTLQIKPNFYRIENVVRRTVRGLYYDSHEKCALPVECPIWIAADIGFQKSSGKDIILQKKFFAKLLAKPPQVIHEDIFSYWTQDVKDQEFMSAWFLLFYTKIWFVAFTNVSNPPVNGNNLS